MTNIYFDTPCSDRDRRSALYAGGIFVYSPSAATKQLCELAEQLINEAFAPHDPRTIDRHLSMEDCSAVLAKLKPAFIHHPDCKRLLPQIISSIGGDPDAVYFDVPRLRSAYPTTYLTSGIAYAFHPHRDTWYSAPMSQINWWLPITEITPQNCLGFYPEYFHKPLRNNSEIYNYAEWNRTARGEAARHVKSDTRVQPRPQEEVKAEPVKIICPPGGLIMFSGAHLHETVPNTSGVARYSIDFRTVHHDDAIAHLGAVNVDSRCTGTTMNDYLRCSDLRHFPEDLVASHGDEVRNPVPPMQ
jgi:Phytanoyl-CoA dioxygenase (PhyH)